MRCCSRHRQQAHQPPDPDQPCWTWPIPAVRLADRKFCRPKKAVPPAQLSAALLAPVKRWGFAMLDCFAICAWLQSRPFGARLTCAPRGGVLALVGTKERPLVSRTKELRRGAGFFVS